MRGDLDEFRVGSPPEISALLRAFIDGNVLLTLAGSGGQSYTTTLWAQDASRGVISFAADADDPRLMALLADEDAVAVGYLDNVKVQWDLAGLTLVRGRSGAALQCQAPYEMFRFQRRGSFRVRPAGGAAPHALINVAGRPGQPLGLRVIDVSLGGLALAVPAGVTLPAPGSVMRDVRLELDADTRVTVNLRVQHAHRAEGHPEANARMGCEMIGLGGEGLRLLQRYIDLVQRRTRILGR
jgi:c-di-GMP-binding flagellar brake protein YcgR